MRTFAFLLVALIAATTHADPGEILKEHGISVSGTNLVVDGEKEFRSYMAKSLKVKKSLNDAAGKYMLAERAKANLEREVTALTIRNGQLNSQLATVRPGDVTTNNRIVGFINANVAQVNLKNDQLQRGEKVISDLRAAASQAREDFMQYVLDGRKLADEIEDKRIAALKNDDVKQAIETLNSEGGKYSIEEPSRAFKLVLKKLTDLEERVLSEDIAIRRDAGGTSEVPVTINGQKAIDMIVDSGASVMCLPTKTAESIGVRPTSNDPPIQLTVADGRTITGTLVKLKTVRVGQFEVENVECAVLGPDATHAAALLGMSFLGKFEFQLNAAQETLTLTRIKEDAPRSTRRRQTR